GEQQAHRAAEVNELFQLRGIQDCVRFAQVSADNPGGFVVREQAAALLGHHRVVVDVDGPCRRIDLLDHLVGVADRGQAGADIDELADALLGDPFRGPLVESPVRPGTIPDLRHRGQDPLGRLDVGLEVVVAPQHVVVNAGGGGPGDVYPGWCTRSPRHLASGPHQSVSTALSVAQDSQFKNGSWHFQGDVLNDPYEAIGTVANSYGGPSPPASRSPSIS